MKAKNLKVGDRYISGKSIQEITGILKITDKAIIFKTKRISPDYYDGHFFQRKRLETIIEKVN